MNVHSGAVLIISLLFLLLMSLLASMGLVLSQLSLKTAIAGQQQLLIDQRALAEHLSYIHSIDPVTAAEPSSEVECPAQYNLPEHPAMQCWLLQFQTTSISDNQQFASRYQSMLLLIDKPTTGPEVTGFPRWQHLAIFLVEEGAF